MTSSTPRGARARWRLRSAQLVALLGCGALVLTACGSGDEPAATSSPSASASDSAPAEPDQTAPAEGASGSQVSGEIAALTGDVAQVQDDSTQTAVTWSADTTFEAVAAASLSDISVGTCVVARAENASDTDSGATQEDAATDTETIDSSEIAVTTIQVSAATDGECGWGGGMPGGGPGGGAPNGGAPSGDAPAGAPDMSGDAPTGPASGEQGSGGPGAMGSVVIGRVTAVSDESVTVESSRPGTAPSNGSAEPSSEGESGGVTDSQADVTDGSSPATTSEAVTRVLLVTDATTITATVASDAEAVEVGRCLSARGQTDDTGTLTATTITVSDKTDEGCSSGRGGRGGMGGFRPDANGSGGPTGAQPENSTASAEGAVS